MTNTEQFAQAYPHIAAWLASPTAFGFAIAMRHEVERRGRLTPNQLAACERCIASRAKAEAATVAIDVSKIEAAFAVAISKGYKKLHLRLGLFDFKPAKAHSRNPGSIYVTQGNDYLGRVTEGKFIPTSLCDDERKAQILVVAADPEAAAIAYGKETTRCSVCGITLTNPESKERGIGPICAAKYGW